jgi:hypothetical protein
MTGFWSVLASSAVRHSSSALLRRMSLRLSLVRSLCCLAHRSSLELQENLSLI